MHRLIVLCCSLLLLAGTARAETKISFRQLTKTHPIAVQRGAKAKVRVHSHFSLAETHSTFFVPRGPVMKYTQKKPPKVEWSDPQELDIGESYEFEITVPGAQVPGVYEYRLATTQAVSSVGQLLISDHPVVVEGKRSNDTPATAQPVPVPAAICGVIDQFEDVDHYQFSGKKGEHLVIQIFAQRVTRAIHCMAIRYPKIHLMDSILTLVGPDGEIVAQNDNHIGGDSLLSCKLPSSGKYTLEVRDLRFAGDPRYVYCVELTRGRRVFGAFPLAVQRQQPCEVQLLDASLVSSTSLLTVPATPTTRLGWTRFRPPAQQRGAYPLLISSHPQRQQVTATTPANAPRLQLPIGVSGRLNRRGDRHVYRFAAKKGRYYKFDVQSQRRGYSVDSVIAVRNKQGKILTRGDDGWFTKDAFCYFQAPQDDDYFVEVRDFNRRGGVNFVYHLRAEPSGPDFELHGEFYYGMLAPGGRAIWFARIVRLNGFRGPVEIRAANLPRGVTMTPVTIPAGMNHCGLIFTAAKDAQINASLVKISGHAKVSRPGRKERLEITRPAKVTCELRRAGASAFVRCPIRSQLLGVTKPLDLLAVESTPQKLTLKRGSSAEIQVQIRRNPKYKDQVLLDMAFSFFSRKYGRQLPPGVAISGKSQLKLTGNKLVGKIVLTASKSALQVKDHPVAALARVPITYSIMTNYASNPIALTVE